jgi:aminoglycoside phosphotransferase (APT) family kinase protein
VAAFPANPDTVEGLLATLRDVTGVADLAFAETPTVLAGGFYAEMVRFRLASPPEDLDRALVARIVPFEPAGLWESTIQRAAASQGFPTPAVRLTAPATSPLGRFLTVMDLVDGEPPLAGLQLSSIVTQIPKLLHGLPDDLARMANRLHRLDPAPLTAELEHLAEADDGFPATTVGFVEWQGLLAAQHGRPDLVAASERLVASLPQSRLTAITHGDLHPFNLLISPDGPVLIDWTVARVAHPGFTLAFTELMLGNPPIPATGVGKAAIGRLGRRMARRFRRTYHALTTDLPELDAMAVDWHRRVHALRIMVELAGWDAAGTRPASGHPWLILEPVAERELGLASVDLG